jgi:DNA-binding PadR family transcriptional regulator
VSSRVGVAVRAPLQRRAFDLLCNVQYICAVPDYLGEFEQLILLALARLGDVAYGVTIRETLIERTGRQPSFGAIYSTLRRLEQKGLVESSWGEPEAVRGGRAKKLVAITARGKAALRESHAAVVRMAEGVTGLKR